MNNVFYLSMGIISTLLAIASISISNFLTISYAIAGYIFADLADKNHASTVTD